MDKIPQFTCEEDRDTFLDIPREHSEFPDFSYKFGVELSEAKGRFGVAKETIEPGEIICKAPTVAGNIQFSDCLDFCYNCMGHASSPIPCQRCSAVVFCSFACRQEAEQRHIYDCPLSYIDIYLSKGNWVRSKIV